MGESSTLGRSFFTLLLGRLDDFHGGGAQGGGIIRASFRERVFEACEAVEDALAGVDQEAGAEDQHEECEYQ